MSQPSPSRERADDTMQASHYDPILVAISFIIAILAAWTALNMSSGVTLMHYTGMVAMDVSPPIVWNYRRVTLPIIIAVLVSFAALWLTFRLRHEVVQVASSLTAAIKRAIHSGAHWWR